MANDNTETLDNQQSAMATDATANTDEVKVRKSPYQNAFRMVLDLITYTPTNAEDKTPPGLIQQWSDETAEGETNLEIREAVVGALDRLREKIQKLHDEPRDDESIPGAWYVGCMSDGSRKAFKFAGTPSEKSAQCVQFKWVCGKFHSAGGAAYVEKHGRGSDTPLVFHRKGTQGNLGAATAVKKSFR
jgi:hypothetical protein